MARKATANEATLIPSAEDGVDTLGMEELPIALQIQNEIDKYDATEEITFKVFRTVPGAHVSKSKYVATLSREEFNEDRLQQPPFNGGDFRIWIMGKNGMKRNFALSVEALPETGKPATSANDDKTMMAFTALTQTMMAGFQRMAESMQTIARQPMPQGMGVQETIQLISALGGLTAKPAPAADPMTMLTQLLTVQKMMKDDAPLPRDDDGKVDPMAAVVDLAKSYAPVIKDMVSARTANASAPQTAAASSPALPHAAIPAETAHVAIAPMPARQTFPNPVTVSEDEMQFQVKMMVPMFLLAAQNNQAVEQYSDLLLNTLPDEAIAQYIEAPDWFDKIAAMESKVIPHKEWFSRLREDILAQLTTDNGDDTTPGDQAPGK